MTEEPSYMLWVGQAVMLSVPGYFILQAWLARSWRGGWRKAALVPLVAMAPAAIFSIIALSQGSNLWPITTILLAPFAFGYLLVVWTLRVITE